MSKIISYDDAMKLAGGKNCTLLLGNGFSIKYFSYKNLLEKADLPAGDPVRILFDRLGTVDFERVVKTLEDASVVERAYGNDAHSGALLVDANRLREALVHAVRGIRTTSQGAPPRYKRWQKLASSAGSRVGCDESKGFNER